MTPSIRRTPAFLLPLLLGLTVAPAATAATSPEPAVVTAGASRTTKVLVVSVDGLRSRALRQLGPDRAPHLHRLFTEGAGTRNARTVRESTWTLPNHTTMVTGRRVDADRGGHGVDWNDDRLDPAAVQEGAGHPVSSVFKVVHSRDRETALFASKPKLSLFERSWPQALDRTAIREDNRRLVRLARRDLRTHRRELTVLHLSRPDVIGHEKGFLSPAYLDAVAATDRMLGGLLTTIDARPRLQERLTLILTSDHGGVRGGHSDPTRLGNYRVPFVVWGVGVAQGADLYELNGDYRDPGRRRTRYGAKRPPVRNGDVANLATDLLGLRPVKGSLFNAAQNLDVS